MSSKASSVRSSTSSAPPPPPDEPPNGVLWWRASPAEMDTEVEWGSWAAVATTRARGPSKASSVAPSSSDTSEVSAGASKRRRNPNNSVPGNLSKAVPLSMSLDRDLELIKLMGSSGSSKRLSDMTPGSRLGSKQLSSSAGLLERHPPASPLTHSGAPQRAHGSLPSPTAPMGFTSTSPALGFSPAASPFSFTSPAKAFGQSRLHEEPAPGLRLAHSTSTGEVLRGLPPAASPSESRSPSKAFGQSRLHEELLRPVQEPGLRLAHSTSTGEVLRGFPPAASPSESRSPSKAFGQPRLHEELLLLLLPQEPGVQMAHSASAGELQRGFPPATPLFDSRSSSKAVGQPRLTEELLRSAQEHGAHLPHSPSTGELPRVGASRQGPRPSSMGRHAGTGGFHQAQRPPSRLAAAGANSILPEQMARNASPIGSVASPPSQPPPPPHSFDEQGGWPVSPSTPPAGTPQVILQRVASKGHAQSPDTPMGTQQANRQHRSGAGPPTPSDRAQQLLVEELSPQPQPQPQRLAATAQTLSPPTPTDPQGSIQRSASTGQAPSPSPAASAQPGSFQRQVSTGQSLSPLAPPESQQVDAQRHLQRGITTGQVLRPPAPAEPEERSLQRAVTTGQEPSPQTPSDPQQAGLHRSVTAGRSQDDQASSPTVSPVRSKWTDDEKMAHVKSLLQPRLPREQQLLDIFSTAFIATPMPAPWVACRENRKRVVFMNSQTGKISLSSPLDETLQELATVCRKIFHLRTAERSSALASLQEKWDTEISAELANWKPAKDKSTGRQYHYHRKTKEAIWQSPAEAFLPAHYFRMKATELFRCAESPPGSPDIDMVEGKPSSGSSDSGKDSMRTTARSLEAQRNLLRSGSVAPSGNKC